MQCSVERLISQPERLSLRATDPLGNVVRSEYIKRTRRGGAPIAPSCASSSAHVMSTQRHNLERTIG